MSFQPRLLADGRVCCSQPYALCQECAAALAEPPDPYAAGLALLKAAAATPESRFEDGWKAARLRDLADERDES